MNIKKNIVSFLPLLALFLHGTLKKNDYGMSLSIMYHGHNIYELLYS